MTSEYKDWADERNIKFPTDPQLTLTFNADGIWLASPLVQYYLQMGMKIDKLYSVVEYTSGKPFKKFVDAMVKKRIEATEQGNKLGGNMAKMLMNSSWGRLGKSVYLFSYALVITLAMNLDLRRTVAYARSADLKNHKNLLLQHVDALHSEYETDLFELTKFKKSMSDKIPGKKI